jgi:hypothetical protein
MFTMQERIDRLRGEIAKLRELASTSDTKAAADLRALATEMEKTVSEMQERMPSFTARSALNR